MKSIIQRKKSWIKYAWFSMSILSFPLTVYSYSPCSEEVLYGGSCTDGEPCACEGGLCQGMNVQCQNGEWVEIGPS